MKESWMNHLIEGATWKAEADMDPAIPICSSLEIRLPTLKSKFPYLTFLCCYCLIVSSKYDMIYLAFRKIISSVIQGQIFLR